MCGLTLNIELTLDMNLLHQNPDWIKHGTIFPTPKKSLLYIVLNEQFVIFRFCPKALFRKHYFLVYSEKEKKDIAEITISIFMLDLNWSSRYCRFKVRPKRGHTLFFCKNWWILFCRINWKSCKMFNYAYIIENNSQIEISYFIL